MTKNTRFTSNGFRLAVLALAIAGSSNANAASVSADAKSTVVAPIQIAKSADLAFGSFAAGATGGTVTVTPGGARSKVGDVTLMTGAGAAAQFNVSGQAGLTYSIVLAATPLNREGGGGTMTLTPVSDLTSGLLAGTGAAGIQSFFVGGDLTVGANQAPGEYLGSVTATVEYN
ncbi:MAG: hypothetical protein JWP72_689 [Massilia sp.]|jgi:hypothetical protein|nr:hypothetical protein [Massilia sp.]